MSADTERMTSGLTIADIGDVDRVLDATREMYEHEIDGLALTSNRFDDLVLARESSKNDYLEFEGLVAQAAGFFPELDGIGAVAELGVEPLLTKESSITVVETDPVTGAETRHLVHLEPLHVGTARGVLFSFRGTAYLYSMTSAAKVNEFGHQDWTRMLIRVILRLRPRRLRAVSVSRYTRNLEVAGLLLHAASQHVDQIWAGPLELNMRGSRAPMDKLLFTMLAMAAALERDAAVSRLAAGKVHAARKNRWLVGPRSRPPGYELVNDTLRPLPAEKPVVEALLRLIVADPTPTEFTKQLGSLGITLRPVQGTGTAPRSAAATRSKNTKKDSYLRLVPLYVTGQKVVKLPNPFPGAKEVSGMPVVLGADGREEVHVVSTFGLPVGGWADPELLDAALAVAIAKSAKHDVVLSPELTDSLDRPEAHAEVASAMEARSKTPQKAPEMTLWSGTRWRDENFSWDLAGRGARTMELTRSPLDLASTEEDEEPLPGDDAAGVDGSGGVS